MNENETRGISYSGFFILDETYHIPQEIRDDIVIGFSGWIPGWEAEGHIDGYETRRRLF